jgi:septal ring factor EnvC (AmiA/AmiB activator)
MENNNVQLKPISFDIAKIEGKDYFVQVLKSETGILTTIHFPVDNIRKELEQRQSNTYADLGKIGEARINLDQQEKDLKAQIKRLEELIEQVGVELVEAIVVE